MARCASASHVAAAAVAAAGGADDVDVDRITLVGLLFETATGIQRSVSPLLERQTDLAGQDFEILIRLARSPATRLRMSDLATQTGLTPSGLTRAVDRLAEAGLVAREACEEDRRGSLAALTAAGGERMQAALDLHRCQLRQLLDGALDVDEQATLVDLLRKVRDRVNPGAATATGTA